MTPPTGVLPPISVTYVTGGGYLPPATDHQLLALGSPVQRMSPPTFSPRSFFQYLFLGFIKH